ncbi:MAG: ribulose-phosphate 3-epimerase [Alphaproteobacteria bacterium]|nr:ribulose-phosphate 3-epimerase [Alphaproteobacteria bacterium]
MDIRLHPSVLSADFVNMEAELQRIASADAVHVDVMDNHFVEALTFGPQMVKRIVEVSPVPLDVHLMIEKPDLFAPRYAELGAQTVTFHVEAASDVATTIRTIQSHGAKAGIAVKPGTPLEPYLENFHEADLVLIMTVEPGAGGQPFLHDVMPKLEAARNYLQETGLSPLLEVDGGITADNAGAVVAAGASALVAGSAVFRGDSYADNIAAIRAAAG